MTRRWEGILGSELHTVNFDLLRIVDLLHKVDFKKCLSENFRTSSF